MRQTVQLHGELGVRSISRDGEPEPARYDDVAQNNYHGYIVVSVQIKCLKRQTNLTHAHTDVR